MTAETPEAPSWTQLLDRTSELMAQLTAVQERLEHLRTCEETRGHLQDERERLQAYQHRRETQTRLQEIQGQIEALDVEMESRLFAWSSFRQPFWAMVRFGGLGFLLGWWLQSGA
ncbi:MAG: hypothetical protein HC918_08415 [Oscillatoriales cyanobacterium SM2_1_8]|nr:hypothetical protein [Oscillatoriales cyanobacterium SM2_1_8]